MKKVKWKWDWGVYAPFCPHCNEFAYERSRCVFCGKKYKWVEDEIKPTVVEHGVYTIIQSMTNHIQVYKAGRLVLHSSCYKKLTDEELKRYADFIENLKTDGADNRGGAS